MSKNIRDFTISTDSEFISVTEDNELVIAADYVEVEDDFGRDDNIKIWEIKAKYDTCPLKVINSMKDIMQRAVENYPRFLQFKWLSGSYLKDCPLGSHIHFGHPKKLISPEDVATQFLDHYIGAISILLEDKKQGIKRRAYNKKGYSYGKMGDIRRKDNNRIDHWEYRTCSSFLSSPHATTAILCLGKLILHEVLNVPSFRPKVYIEKDDFVNMNQEKIRGLFDKIWEDIMGMTLYPIYAKQLSIIPYLVKNNLTWNLKRDMKESWGIIGWVGGDKTPQRLIPLLKPAPVALGVLDSIWFDFENGVGNNPIIEEANNVFDLLEFR